MQGPSPDSVRRHRLLAVLVGVGFLVLLEGLLRLLGIGGPGDRPDPFAGFSPREELLVEGRDAEDRDILRIRDDKIGTFNRVSFPARKAAGQRRLFCLGGSSTFGFPYAAESSFCADLEAALGILRPETRVRVVNLGGMSYGSRRVLNVMREMSSHAPDGFIVYMGHNEYVERRFFAPFLTESGWRRGLRGALHRVRIYVLLRRLLAPLTAGPAGQGDDLFGIGPIRDDSRRQPRSQIEDRLVEEQFHFVLEEMVQIARRLQVPLFLVNPGTNLRDWAPEASDWQTDLEADERRERDTAFSAARSLYSQQRLGEALEATDAVVRLDPRPAEVHHLRGQILAALNRPVEAAVAFREARDRDAAPIRITGPLQEAIRESWAAFALQPLDAAAALAAVSPAGLTGREMVLDYCHPSRAGHRHIAELLLPAVQQALWPDTSPRSIDWQQLGPREGSPASAFGAAWAGQMALRQGDLETAAGLFRRAVEIDPRLATAHEGLGRTLAMSGQVPEAVAALEQATQLDPTAATGWNNLGLAYGLEGRHAEAEAAFRRALASGAGVDLIRVNRAGALLQLGLLDEAVEELHKALAGSPGEVRAWLRLGQVRAAQGLSAEAADAFRRALELSPGNVSARTGLEALAPAAGDTLE